MGKSTDAFSSSAVSPLEELLRGASTKTDWRGRLRHFAYAAGWKKFEPLWDFVMRAKKVARMLPVLEAVLGREAGHNEAQL